MPSPTAEVTAEPIGTVEERIAALVPALMDEGFKVSQSNRIDELWGTLLVGIGDEILGTATRGFANEEEAIEHSPDAVWPLVGMTDLFTVVGILQLHEQGELDIDAPVSELLDDFPNGDVLTLHHLLTRTSGMTELLDWQVEPKNEPGALAKAFEVVKAKRPGLNPGTRYSWGFQGNRSLYKESPASTEYVIARYLLEQVSGQSFEEYVVGHIFEPAGMETAFFASPKEVESMPVGYWADEWTQTGTTISVATGLSLENPDDLLSPIDDGKLAWGTTADMFRWYRALVNGEYVSEQMLDRMFEPTVDLSYDLRTGHAAYGWIVQTGRDRDAAWFSFVRAGFGAEIQVDRKRDITAVLFINRDNYSVNARAWFTGRVVLKVAQELEAR